MWFKNTFKFSNNDINKFILLLIKGVYPYQCISDWEMFSETKQQYLKKKNLIAT